MPSSGKTLLTGYQYTLIPALLLFMAGALMASSGVFPLGFWLFWMGVAGVCVLMCVLFARQIQVVRWFVWFLAAMIGAAYFTIVHFEPLSDDISYWADRSQASVSGTVVGLGPKPGQWVVRVHQLDAHEVSGQVLMKLNQGVDDKGLQVGDTVQLQGKLSQPFTAHFPGGFDYKTYLKQQHMTAVFYTRSIQVEALPSVSVWLKVLRVTDQYRGRLKAHFQEHLPSPESEILGGIVLGEHAIPMDYAVKSRFIRAGLIHVLAASGLNVGLIGAFFLLVGTWCRLPLRLNLTIAMVGVGFYCLLTGLPPSVQRAGLMMELALLLKMVRRELTAVSLLCVTGTVLVLLNPMVVGMLGFQLSFLSSFGLLAMMGPVQRWFGFYVTRWVAAIVFVPLVAQLWVTPLLLSTFHQVQLASWPANIVALPLVTMATYVGFIFGGLSLVSPEISGWVITQMGMVLTGLKQVALFFGDIPGAVWVVGSPPLPTIVMMYVGLFALAYGFHVPERLAVKPMAVGASVVLMMVLLPMGVSYVQAKQYTTISVFMDQYRRPMQVIEQPNGQVVVSARQLSFGNGLTLQSYLQQLGTSHVNTVLFSDTPSPRTLDTLARLGQQVSIGEVVVPSAQGKVPDVIQTPLGAVKVLAQREALMSHHLKQGDACVWTSTKRGAFSGSLSKCAVHVLLDNNAATLIVNQMPTHVSRFAKVQTNGNTVRWLYR